MGQPKQPTISWHGPSKRAYITYAKKRYYLGRWESKEQPIPKAVRLKFHAIVGQLWHLGKAEPPPNLEWSVGEMADEFLDAIKGKFSPGEYTAFELATVAMVQLFGPTPAKAFTAGKLRQIQEYLLGKELSRIYINAQVGRIVRVFKWAVSFDRLDPSVLVAVKTVPGIPPGTRGVKESPGVNMVPLATVKETLPLLPEPVKSMVMIQLLTGARPGEVRAMTWGAIDRTEPIWIYRPVAHKTARLGKVREIPLGPAAQAVLMPFLRANPDAYVFDASNNRGANTGRPRGLNRPYHRVSYPIAVRRVCEDNGLDVWQPRQLRKLAAQRVDDALGIEWASALLGHGGSEITRRVYAKSQLEKAKEAALKIEKIS
jgi:integrase